MRNSSLQDEAGSLGVVFFVLALIFVFATGAYLDRPKVMVDSITQRCLGASKLDKKKGIEVPTSCEDAQRGWIPPERVLVDTKKYPPN